MGSTAAVVVGYHPDTDVLVRLLLSLIDQVDILVVVDNGGTLKVLSALPDLSRVKYVDMDGNAGLGAALNAGFERATALGAEHIVTFDQDSHPSPTLINDLAAAMNRALQLDPQCVAVGPTFYDRREENEVVFPFYRAVSGRIVPTFSSSDESGLIPADVLITSGMYIRAAAWQDGLKYDESMFVDFTDTEWCFRARSAGHSLYGASGARMGHALSDAVPIKLGGLTFFRYTPLRRYFYFRNTLAICFGKYAPKPWKRRLLAGLVVRFFANIVIDTERSRSVAMMCRGIRHGLKKSFGPWH